MTMEIPADLMVAVRRSHGDTLGIPARQILDVPTDITGIHDGTHHGMPPGEAPLILLDIPWHKDFAGNGFEDVQRVAAELAAHLAAIDGDWPTCEAHVRDLPVVEAKFSFLVTPRWVPEGEQPGAAAAEALMARLADDGVMSPEDVRKLSALPVP